MVIYTNFFSQRLLSIARGSEISFERGQQVVGAHNIFFRHRYLLLQPPPPGIYHDSQPRLHVQNSSIRHPERWRPPERERKIFLLWEFLLTFCRKCSDAKPQRHPRQPRLQPQRSNPQRHPLPPLRQLLPSLPCPPRPSRPLRRTNSAPTCQTV